MEARFLKMRTSGETVEKPYSRYFSYQTFFIHSSFFKIHLLMTKSVVFVNPFFVRTGVDIPFGEDGAMAKYKSYDYSQGVLIPVSLEEQLMPGTLEFAIHTLVETRIDTSIFGVRYNNDETGRLAYDPKILLKVVLFGYSRGLISSRQIERACRENVTFMALSCGEHPDHSTIAGFVSSMRDEVLPIFRDVLLVCEEERLLGGTFFALDGCKLPSNASKEWSGTIGELRRKKERLEKKVKQLVEEQVEIDRREDEGAPERRFFGGVERGRQIERLREKAGRLERWLEENRSKMGRRGKEIKSNVTDNESALMITSHGTIQGYNGQALVDSKDQVIVHAEAFGEAQDLHLIPPVLEGAKENMRAIGCGEDYFEGKILTADSNYHSPPNLGKCEQEGLDAYIPDKRFRRRDSRFEREHKQRQRRTDRLTLADFEYQEERDEYRCPHGRVFRLEVKETVNDGVIYKRYSNNEEGCKGCELKARCVKGKKAKRSTVMVPIGSAPGRLTKAMAAKIDSEQGRRIYHRRIAIAEPVFANIRVRKVMNRFTLRGKIKVNVQWLLYCMVHNIGKILNFGFKYAFS
jgi:transposase